MTATLIRCLLSLSGAVVLGWLTPIHAQITPDSTLGTESSQFTPDAVLQGELTDLIEGGAARGGNLFHSFEQFNIADGQRVFFANPLGIENILSRVTGGDPSNIFGTLGVDGPANLFFMNPNGIVFGLDVTLDIPGSFHATTADAIPLGNVGIFSATAPEQSTLLTVDPSIFFTSYLNADSGDISNRGQLAANGDLTLAANTLDLVGQVAAGGNLTLLGLDTVQIRDVADAPFIGFSGADLLVQGNERVDIVALNHPDSALSSYGNLLLRSANPVAGDAAFWSGGSFRVETLAGEIGDLYSPIDPIIRSRGDVEIGLYSGGSLHIVAGGSVSLNTIGIITPDPGTAGIDFLQETITLTDGTVVEIDGGAQPTLDVRAGVAPAAVGTIPIPNPPGFFPALGLQIGDQPASADIDVAYINMAGANGQILLTNQYAPNPALTGDITIAGRSTFLGQSGIFASPQLALLGTEPGDVYIDSRGDVQLVDSTIQSSGVGGAGNIVVNAADTIRLEQTTGTATIVANLNPGRTGVGGNIRLTGTNLELLNGAQIQAATLGAGNAGDIVITVRDRARFEESTVANSVAGGGVGQGGDIQITAGTVELQDGASLISRAFGRGNAGNITVTARDRVSFDNTSSASSRVGNGATGDGGNITITANALEVTRGSQLIAITNGNGDAGNVTINVNESAVFRQRSPDGAFTSSVFTQVDNNGVGNAGEIEITANVIEVDDGAQLISGTEGDGDAENVIITARESILLDNTSGSSQNRSGIFGSVESTAVGNGGDVSITTGNLTLRNGAQVQTSTRGNGSAGDVVLRVADAVLVDGTSTDSQVASGILSEVGVSAVGEGGDIDVITRSLTARNGGNLSARTAGNGNAGTIKVTAGERVVLQGASTFGQPTTIATGNEPTAIGRGNTVRITAPSLQILDGAVIEASTSNAQPGGAIVLDLNELAIFDGGQVVSSSAGAGTAGNIQLDANSGIQITGSNPNFGQQLARNPAISDRLSANSRLSVQSDAAGAAGNIMIGARGTTPTIFLDQSGQIIAESAAVDGGNITLNLTELLLLRNNSLISASAGTAQAPGNGGNITINVPFIIAIPEENSDIAADAFEGTGGNVNITARGIFGIEPRPQRTPLSDITASSELGINGTVSLTVLDTGFIENNLSDFDENIVDTAALTAGSCIARTDNATGSFVVTGGEGLPQRPGGDNIAVYPTGTVQTVPEPTPAAFLQEPQSVYRLADGRLVLSHECE
ncbi:two-partner secretion domain-containing protein [Leptolyngbya iicbica]|uniref:Filamentous hemagglutinin N-terminal domain-containing protein n=2 Tax=Cyanophyceae TaxID=3028117 RepID=A0A4Q7E2C4_9CYAN|nr:filamentous hemagglutinin N-terminal domain-containing protein [Leptolyngbya sp. LK]RZM76570.1 filamentous hemagglutinin N-terminal domain-containing protein [Leptolyngbya sp. LK]